MDEKEKKKIDEVFLVMLTALACPLGLLFLPTAAPKNES